MKVSKMIRYTESLFKNFKWNKMGMYTINSLIKNKQAFTNTSLQIKPQNFFINIKHNNFSIQQTNKIKLHFNSMKMERLTETIEKINLQNQYLHELKKYFEKNESKYFSDESRGGLVTYPCPNYCLTINTLFSDRFDLRSQFLNLYITESRNELRYNLKKIIQNINDQDNLKIQVCGSVGTGKTFGLADFVVLERMLNLQSKDKFLIYYNFHENSNPNCQTYIVEEILCALYPLIKDELNKILNSSQKYFELEENSLLHLILELSTKQYIGNDETYLIKDIFTKINENYPNYKILVILDQINEVGKGKFRDTSSSFFKFFTEFQQKNLISIFCASNNNEFNRKNILYDYRMIILNYDLRLTDEEAVTIIREKGYIEEEQIRGILKITNKIPLFIKFLTKDGIDNLENIKNLIRQINDYISSRAENFYKNYYMKLENDEKIMLKQIIYYLNSEIEFDFHQIKDIIDYQLFDLEFVNPHEKEIYSRAKNEKIQNDNQLIRNFYNFINNKIDDFAHSNLLKQNFLRVSALQKVRVITKYPMIIRIYRRIFKENMENLITPNTLTLAIRDYLRYNYKREENLINYDTENQTRSKWGYYFEDIINMFIKENKINKLTTYSSELEFMEKWHIQRYYDPINPIKNLENPNEKNILQIKDPTMFYSQYPPLGNEFVKDLIDGLNFINFKSNESTVDGGFAYLSTQLDTDKDGKKRIVENVLNIYTYNVTIADKTKSLNLKKRIQLTENLKKVYKNIEKIESPLIITKENFIRHYFIVLEDDEIYNMTEPINPNNMPKAMKLFKHLDKHLKENREIFGIICARFVKIDGNYQTLTIQLFPFNIENYENNII